MPSIRLPSGVIHYREQGHEQGKRTPMVLLHANPGDSRDYAAVMPVLAEHYHVLALDWPGYGQSGLPEQPDTVDVNRFCQVLEEFVSAKKLSPVILVGNSVGGLCAVKFALRFPQQVSVLVLVSPGGFTPHNVLSRAFCRLQGSALALPPHRWAGLYLKHRNDTTRAMLDRARHEQRRPGQLAVNRAIWRSFISPRGDLRTEAKGITQPVLLLFGKSDPAISATRDGKQAHLAIPHAHLHILPCGHAAFAELPEEFCRRVLEFLGQKKSVRQDPAIGKGNANSVNRLRNT